jgi:thymidine kinase
MAEVTYFKKSDDVEVQAALQKEALKKAIAFRKKVRREMKDLRTKKKELYKELKGNKKDPKYIAAEEAFYFQKAKVDILTKVVNDTVIAAKKA